MRGAPRRASCSTSWAWPTRWCTRPARRRPCGPAGGTVPLPPGTLLGVPTSGARLDGVLSPAGTAAARAERDRPLAWTAGGDVALGGLLRERFGDELADRLVDPLLGGVYAGRVDVLGLPRDDARARRRAGRGCTVADRGGRPAPLPSRPGSGLSARSAAAWTECAVGGLGAPRRIRRRSSTPCSARAAARRCGSARATVDAAAPPRPARLAAGCWARRGPDGARRRRGGARRARARRSPGC